MHNRSLALLTEFSEAVEQLKLVLPITNQQEVNRLQLEKIKWVKLA